jgi:CRP/FNR family transcriptional activator FtrB
MNDTLPEADELPLLRALTPARRAALLRHASVHRVAAGSVLFEQGETPSFQLLLLDGSVHLLGQSSSGPEALIEVVNAPDLIIPAAVLTGAAYLMRARTPGPARLLLIQADAFRAAVARDATLARAVIDDLAGQYRRMVRQLKNLKLRSTHQRVGCHLLKLARQQGWPERVTLPYQKSLVASELGMTRESFSRALSALQHEGISVEGDAILIRDPHRLAAASGLDLLIDGPDAAPPP